MDGTRRRWCRRVSMEMASAMSATVSWAMASVTSVTALSGMTSGASVVVSFKLNANCVSGWTRPRIFTLRFWLDAPAYFHIAWSVGNVLATFWW